MVDTQVASNGAGIPPGMLARKRQPPGSSSRARVRALSPHQRQYEAREVAEFFDEFNNSTGRPELFFGYLAGSLNASRLTNNRNETVTQQKIAVDFGCGTGWLTPRLHDLGFNTVYGIDTSESMLQIAFRKTLEVNSDLINSGKVRYFSETPEEIKGKCSFVAALHVHYHFEDLTELQTNFFGIIASMLDSRGEAILVGCPSDYIRNTPEHFQNKVHKDNVPDNIRSMASSLKFLADKDGFVPLSSLPPYPLKDGEQMKVVFKAFNGNGVEKSISLKDTFWSDCALIDAASRAGLHLLCRQDLSWRSHPHAYMMMHFRKQYNRDCAR